MTRQTGILIIFLAALLLGGCARATLTNLTVGQQPRDANGFYRVEIIWENDANGVRHETKGLRTFLSRGRLVQSQT